MTNRKERRISKTPRESIIKTTRCTKNLKYGGTDLGTVIIKTEIYLTEWQARELFRKVSIDEKLDLKNRVPSLYKLKKAYRLTNEEILSNYDIEIHTADKGYKSLTEVEHNDPILARRIKERGLEREIFKDFSPKNESDSFIENQR
ncbi:MAG: hypothetical protein ABIH79_01880 [archaeon]